MDDEQTSSQIDRLYVWLGTRMDTGQEGFLLIGSLTGIVPLIATTRDVADKFERAARDIGQRDEVTVRLVEFVRGDIHTEIGLP